MKVAPLIGFPGRRLTGTTLKENLTSAGTQLRTLAEIDKMFDPDIVFIFMDLSVEAESLGLKIDFPDEASPTVIESPLENADHLEEFRQIDFTSGRMQLFLDVVKGFKRVSAKELAAYATGPFTLACLLMGTNRAAASVLSDPLLLHGVMEFTAGLVAHYVHGLAESGADHIVILEPSSVILSPGQFRSFSFPYIERIFTGIDRGRVLHICGNTTHLFREMRDLGTVTGLSLDSAVNLGDAYRMTKKTVIGNVNPSIVCFGTHDDISREIDSLLKQMEGIPDFILSTGCDLPPETPVENILHFMRIAREDGRCPSPTIFPCR
jgi:uroporphyrinogen decarboxylase